MSKATHTHSTGSPASLRAAGSGPDAELIRLCGEFIEGIAIYDGSNGVSDEELEPLASALRAIEKQLDGLRPRTMEGLLAKAQIAEALAEPWHNDWPEKVLRELLALTKPAPIGRKGRGLKRLRQQRRAGNRIGPTSSPTA